MTEHPRRDAAPSTCTSTCGPPSWSTGCARAPRRRTCAAGRCTPTANRRTTWTRHGHDVAARVAADREAGVGTACLSLSSPLGIEGLLRPEAQPLLDAWHRGVRELPGHFRAWASVPTEDAGLDDRRGPARRRPLRRLQLPATDLLTPFAWERVARVAAGRRARRASRCSCTPDRSRAGCSRDGCPSGGRPSSATPRSCRPHGGAGTPSAAGPVPAAAGPLRCRRGARARAHRAPRAARRGTYDGRPRRLRRHLRRPVLGRSRRSCACSGSTRSCSAATAPTASRSPGFLGDAATHAVRVANPARLLGPRGGDDREVSPAGQVTHGGAALMATAQLDHRSSRGARRAGGPLATYPDDVGIRAAAALA